MAVGTDIHRGLLLAGRYRVERRIGLGGTAAVFLAHDEVLDREVAVKRVHTDGTEDDTRRLRREARIGAALTHPNLVMVYDTISAEDGAYIVMEYVEGRPLAELIGEYGIEPDEALPILWSVADALDYAHRNGVVHRDVKPANVLIGDDGQVKLVDLGAAIGADTTRVTRAHEVVGTLSYLAPERLAGESTGEPAGDIYSLAVLALQTLTGRLPWPTASPQEQLGRALNGVPDIQALWPEASPDLARALERGMDPEPSARPATAATLIADVEEGLTPDFGPTQAFVPPLAAPAGGEPPPAPAGWERSWPRRAAPAALVAGALLAAVIAAAAIGGGDSSSPTAGSTSASAQGRSASTQSGSAGGAKSASTSTSTSSAPTPAGPKESATAGSATSGADLNDQGYALIQEGNHAAAIPILRRAVTELRRDDPSSLTYAYALYNLGHALRLDGQPEAAIPILEERLKFPDQTETVQAELDAARAAAGEPTPKTPPAPPAEKPPKDEGPPHGRALGHDKPGGVPPAGEGEKGD